MCMDYGVNDNFWKMDAFRRSAGVYSQHAAAAEVNDANDENIAVVVVVAAAKSEHIIASLRSFAAPPNKRRSICLVMTRRRPEQGPAAPRR